MIYTTQKHHIRIHFQKYMLALITLAYIGLQANHLQVDFWNDELYSLKCFVFENPIVTLTDYHVPNNHVFFNLINNLYLKMIGVQDLFVLMDQPYKLRILFLAYSLLTILYVFMLGRIIVGPVTGLLAALFLMTNVAYINTALQARGYGLSTMLDVMMLYYGVLYVKKKKFRNLLFVTVLTALSFYTIPLNLYFFLSVMAYLMLVILRSKNKPKPNGRGRYAYWIYAMLLGILMGGVLYSPIFNDVFFNKYVTSPTMFNWVTLHHVAPSVLLHFISGRWFLVFMAVIGYVIIFKQKSSGQWLGMFICLLVLPFIISFIRGDDAPYRVFANLAPAFDLWMAVGLGTLLRTIGTKTTTFLIVFIMFSVGLGVHLQNQFKEIDLHILNDIKTQGHAHNLYYNFFLSRYHPNEEVRFLKDSVGFSVPFVIIRGSEPHGLPNYLEKHGIPNLSKATIPALFETRDSIVVFSYHPLKFCERFYNDYPEGQCNILSKELNYNTIILISKNKSKE